MGFPAFFPSIFFLGLFFFRGTPVLVDDKQALLDFANTYPHVRSLNWNEQSSVCKNWTGVACSEDGFRVIGLRLPGVGFHGPIPQNTVGRLSALQILSLRSNGITGPFPPDFYNLQNLSYLYLQFNNFSGPLPLNFSAWKNLTILDLSDNKFSGSIPPSISYLSQLASLNLANNYLSGEIPDLDLRNLLQLNLSNNYLTGIVPKSLQRFPNSVFVGNNLSLSYPMVSGSPVASSYDTPNPKSKNAGKVSEKALLGIVITCCVVGIAGFAFVVLVCLLRRKGEDVFAGKLEKGDMSPEKAISRTQDANNRLFFFEGCNYAFDLEDLLRASAEVLGKGTFGMAYKAVLEDATTVVVKRLKEVSVGKREFEQQMELVGSIKHENVIELKAYYYSKDEKLMVYDYYSQGSVASMLHGKRGEDRSPLDWETRMKIAIGAARGIAHLHVENGGKLVHGNIKSSNVFLNSKRYGCVSDLGLSMIMSPLAARGAGYRAPEVMDTRKASQAADVYSFGVLILELLTGKSPIYATSSDEVIHLVRWVHSVVREEWTAEVFDLELMRYPNIEEEMVEMLQIAMSCVVRIPDQRPKILDVLAMIENIRHMEPECRPSLEAISGNSTPTPTPTPSSFAAAS